MRKLSESGLAIIKAAEGLRLHAYRDTGGIWTIGYGHTKDVRQGDVITEHQADVMLASDVAWAETCVNTRAPNLNQNQFDACCSFTYNVGCARFGTSTMLRLIRAGDFRAAAVQFDRFIHDSKGKVQPGLIKRRKAERTLFETSPLPDFTNVEAGIASTAPAAKD